MKLAKRITLIAVCAVLILLLAAYILMRRTLPPREGRLELPGLQAGVTVHWNRYGIPRIEAESPKDLFFCIGYIHASDRLFQMDLSRRLATGTLSEVFGRQTLESDRFHRDLLIDRSITDALAHTSPQTAELMQQYCRGVNTYIRTRPRPPEFVVLGYHPEPWRAKDAMAILRNMELILAGSGSELYNQRIFTALGAEKAARLIGGIFNETIIDEDELPAISKNQSLSRLCDIEQEQILQSLGSNSWAISADRSASGSPFFANDPHLPNVFPSFFYQLFASCPGLVLSGNTLPGVPFIVIGRNDHIGWGFTNTGTDVIDYFQLQTDESGEAYFFDGNWEPFDEVVARITVKDGPDVDHRVKTCPLGPVFEINDRQMVKHSVSLYPSTMMDAFMQMNLADNLDEFLAGAAKFTSPAQNLVYTTRSGNIGYYPVGLIPRRRKGDGSLPVSITRSDETWAGFIRETEKPRLLNPAKGYIVTANNPVIPDSHLPIFTRAWHLDFRADRIEDLLKAKKRLTLEDMKNIQTDTHLLSADFLINQLDGVAAQTEGSRFVLHRLRKWDRRLESGIHPFLFYQFEHHLAEAVFAHHISDPAEKDLISAIWLYKILNYPRGPVDTATLLAWTDDPRTTEKEEFQDRVLQSLERTYRVYREWTAEQGKPAWRRIHTLSYRHPLGGVALFKSFLNRGPFSVRGGKGTILTASFPGNGDFRVTHLATFRMILDLSDEGHSLMINSSGQSGHFMSSAYDDQISLYVDLEYRLFENWGEKTKHLQLVPQDRPAQQF